MKRAAQEFLLLTQHGTDAIGVLAQPLVVTAQVSNSALLTSVALFLDVDQTTINPASAPTGDLPCSLHRILDIPNILTLRQGQA